MLKNKVTFMVIILLLMFYSSAHASEVMPWITPTGIGGFEVETYYSWSSREVKFALDDEVSSAFSYITSPIMMKLSFRPGLGYSPYFKLGILSSELSQDIYVNYEERINRWFGGFNGFAFGTGIRYVLGGDAIIVGQLLVDAGLTYYYSGLESKQIPSGAVDTITLINHSLTMWELHCSIIAVKAIEFSNELLLTPYGGVNVLSDHGRWNALAEGTLSGNSSSIHPLAGIEISFKFVSLKTELSFMGGFGIAAGLNIDL